jgi:hypothetical protein
MLRYLDNRLSDRNSYFFAAYATLCAFLLYSCMYAFRKPYTAASYAAFPELFGLAYKELLVLAQVVGYALSKFLGIRAISAMDRTGRARAVVGLISGSWVALLLLAVLPPALGLIALFLNGLSLGLIWGLVFSYLEGRRNTELLGLGLCASFVLSGGVVKDIGRALLQAGVSEAWMPFATGAIFFLPMVLLAWALERVPPPDQDDIAQRTRRALMTAADRGQFLRRFGPGLLGLVLVYILLSAYRTFRDDFMAEVWAGLRPAGDVPAFSQTEIPVALSVLLVLLPSVLLRNNRAALLFNLSAVALGVLGCALATLAFRWGMLSDFSWMLALGCGSYLAYIPYNAILFDRLIAYLRKPANAGFLIYLADAFGYAGSVLLLGFNSRVAALDYPLLLERISLALGALGLVFTVAAAAWFLLRPIRA